MEDGQCKRERQHCLLAAAQVQRGGGQHALLTVSIGELDGSAPALHGSGAALYNNRSEGWCWPPSRCIMQRCCPMLRSTNGCHMRQGCRTRQF